MSLENEQELRRLMREEFRAVRTEEYQEQGLDFNLHSEHHSFICTIRKRLQTAAKAGIWTFVGTIVAGILGLVWASLKKGGF